MVDQCKLKPNPRDLVNIQDIMIKEIKFLVSNQKALKLNQIDENIIINISLNIFV